ncbi:MFS transporter [Amycolatopsis sp. YIM 10]|uniref:MFS transporter n=1 Tax=Amycolatopsis sp. YIM 10 TaxID=2653857 RepID=UPI0012901785|nr:MFS transporter [Amycolatopsis sp. YIM 10]QFU90501.1 Inner membrane protein YbjJ [Amycolatopsis sp. YIM 10]
MSAPTTPEVRRWRAALFAMFLLTGITFASWVTRTPAIRDSVGASTAQMGVIIAGLSVGSLFGIAVAGKLVVARGGRFVIALGAVAMVGGLLLIALGAAVGAGWLVCGGLAFFGLGMGASEVAQNVEGAEIERALAASVLPAMHGCFSIGTFAGALAGIALNALAVPVALHVGTSAALMAAVSVWAVRGIPAHAPAEDEGAPKAKTKVWREPRVVLIGVIVLGMALAEGSANDWLPLITVDGFGATATIGSVAYALFGLAMSVGRFSGSRVLDRFGRATAMRGSAVIATAGVALVILAPGIELAAVGVVLWGLGTSLGFPVALSAAGDEPENAAARVSAVATIGYLAFLVGPPLLGLLGEYAGLRNALVVVLVMLLVAGACAPAVRVRGREAASRP